MSLPPVTSDELKLERETAAELGITIDDLRARRIAELEANRGARWVPAAPRPAERHTAATIELGNRKIAEIRAQLAQRQKDRDHAPHRNPRAAHRRH